jgi:Protein of unknown function (DUF1501)
MKHPERCTACAGFYHSRLSRRALLRVGTVGIIGMGARGVFGSVRQASSIRTRANAVIFLHQFGGPSHLDTLDMKPDEPTGIRGELQPIATKVPGIRVCELLPRLAAVADKFALVHSMHHSMKSHNPATYYSLTGHVPPIDDIRLRDSLDLFPAYGSVVDKLSLSRADMPSFVAYPHVLRDGSITPGQHASFLGKAHDPFFLAKDPNASDFKLPELSLPANLSLDRLENRRQVLALIDRQSELLEFSATARGIDASYERAITMLTSTRVKKAFDLSAEPPEVREKYGRTTYGQGCLLARRLVEAGAKFVNVYFSDSIGGQDITRGGWDTHGFNNKPMYPVLKKYLIPITDQVLPTLLEDLDARGLLESTLIVWMGEFGRSPRINNMAGRDHWPQCYTALVAGGGTRRGFVYGSSDKTGAYPGSNPVRPDDLAATMFDALGIDPHTEVHDALNRPFPIASGQPIGELFA